MKTIRNLITRIFPPHQLLPAGSYHYQSPPDAPHPYRLHLRLEPDGLGMLVLNARTVLHLNQTAAEMVYYFIHQTPPEDAAREISHRYPISKQEALKDYSDIQGRIQTLLERPDLDPEIFLDFERKDLFSNLLSAPIRIDCALTYRSQDLGDTPLAPVDRAKRELSTDEWRLILKTAHEVGILHVIFTGGEPTLRPDLCELVRQAEDLEMVAGLLTNGLKLTEKDYLHALLQSGLDHVMVLFDPSEDHSWEALRDILAEDIFLTVHLTLDGQTAQDYIDLLDRISAMGVKSLSLSASNPDLKELLDEVAHSASFKGFSLVTDLPVPYSRFHPIALELAEAGQPVDGAGKAWIYVEPDGDVLPGQGINEVRGNFLVDSWDSIWNNI